VAIRVLVLVGVSLLCVAVVLLVRQDTTLISGRTPGVYTPPPGDEGSLLHGVPAIASHRTLFNLTGPEKGGYYVGLVCPSVVQWAEGHTDSYCGNVIRRDSRFALVYLACGLIGAGLAAFAIRHRKRLLDPSLTDATTNGRGATYVTYADPPEAMLVRLRDWWSGRPPPVRRLGVGTYALLFGLMVVVGIVTVLLVGPRASARRFEQPYSCLEAAYCTNGSH
jgi:hypothetical protein